MKIGRQTKLSWACIAGFIAISGLIARYDIALTLQHFPNRPERWIMPIALSAVSLMIALFLSQSQFSSRGMMLGAGVTIAISCIHPFLVLSTEGLTRGKEMGLTHLHVHEPVFYIAFPFMLLTALPLLIIIIVSQGKPEWNDIEQLEIEVKEAEATALINPMAAVARGHISNKVRTHIIRRDSCTCLYCGRQGTEAQDPLGQTWHIDHVIPVRRGGPTHSDNLALACSVCNRRKGALPPYQFIQTILQESRN